MAQRSARARFAADGRVPHDSDPRERVMWREYDSGAHKSASGAGRFGLRGSKRKAGPNGWLSAHFEIVMFSFLFSFSFHLPFLFFVSKIQFEFEFSFKPCANLFSNHIVK